MDAISEEIKKEWEQGNLWSTRKLLAEYMTLRPYDSQAIELKKTISKLDRQGAAGWKGERTETMASSRHVGTVEACGGVCERSRTGKGNRHP